MNVDLNKVGIFLAIWIYHVPIKPFSPRFAPAASTRPRCYLSPPPSSAAATIEHTHPTPSSKAVFVDGVRGLLPKDSSCTPSPPRRRGAIIAAPHHRATVYYCHFPDVLLLLSLPVATSLCRSHQWLVFVCSARSVVATCFCCSSPAVE